MGKIGPQYTFSDSRSPASRLDEYYGFNILVDVDVDTDTPSTSALPPPPPSSSLVLMADRFPSLEDLSVGTHTPGANTSNLDDDFLTRERAALGDDADFFTSTNDKTVSANVQEDDLLGGDYSGGHKADHNAGEEITEFESSFPAVNTQNERVAPGGTITGSDQVNQGQPSYGTQDQEEEEPEPIRLWRERRDLDLARRAEASAAKKAATMAKARAFIDDFYDTYNKKKDKALAKARKEAEEFLASREDTSAGGTSWERVSKLVDLSGKGNKGGASGTSKEKFRDMLLDLKKDEKAPGAQGY